VVVVVAGACGGGGGRKVTGATVPKEESTSPTSSSVVATTTTVANYDIPATIDQAYVQRVVSAHDHALGDAIRVMVRDKAISDDFLKYLVGLYTADEFQFQQKAWDEEVRSGFLGKVADPVADPHTDVGVIGRADATCIVVRADRDLAPVLRAGEPQAHSPQDNYFVLVPKPPNRDPLGINPTPWVMAFDGFKQDNSVPEEACG